MVLALLLILAGCAGDSTQAVLDLAPLQMEMAAEFGGWNVVAERQDGDTLRLTMVGEASGISLRDLGRGRAREIAEGLTNAHIAERLVLSEKTVKGYVSNILRTLPGRSHPGRRVRLA